MRGSFFTPPKSQVDSGAGLAYGYNNANRLTAVANGPTPIGSYQVNALGQRVQKTAGGATTTFVYDEQGHLLGEYDATGNLIQETVWLEDLPVATLRASGSSGTLTLSTLETSVTPAPSGTTVTFTATVTGTNPSGSVNFVRDGISLPGCGAVALTGSGNSKTAVCTSKSLPVGSSNIVAEYSGDTFNVASMAPPVTQWISGTGLSITPVGVGSSANPSAPGTAITFTAKVSPGATGSITFTDGVSVIPGCAAMPLPAGPLKVVTCSTSGLAPGSHYIVASYSGNASYAVSASPIVTQVITGAQPGNATGIYYVHADHLGSPRAITRPSDDAVMWQWDNADPFGANPADENPNGQGAFRYNLRFPGQYYDAETGTSYNNMRDYDPAIGRYIESDPIGLKGGLNTYAYAGSDPLSRTDPAGMLVETPTVDKPPVKPPGMPPQGPGGGDSDCVHIPPWRILVARGGIWGFFRKVTVQCSYYCAPPFCPQNPGDYVYHKTLEDQDQIAPWLSPCPPKLPRSEF